MASDPDSGLDDAQEDLKFHYGFKSPTCSFSVTVGRGQGMHDEQFEWRQSHGDEVKALDEWHWGLKLVRLNNEKPDEGGGKGKNRKSGESSDGKEIVAVWADTGKLSMSKIGKFQFLGSGATGELGECWAIMAIVSVVRLWQINYSIVVASTASS
jgi:hypothetical protein